MAGEQLVPWIDSGDAEGNRNSMQNFEGDGIITSWDFNFAGGYIDVSHVKAYIYHTASGLTDAIDPVVLTGPNTIQVIPAVPDGDFLVVYRDTPKDEPLVDYTTGAVLSEANLDMSNQQAVFAAAEMSDRFDAINASSADAIERSFIALETANEALAASDQAALDAASAAASAAAAAASASTAVTTANDALAVANGIDAKATEALANSEEAIETANEALAATTGGFNNTIDLYVGATDGKVRFRTGDTVTPGNTRWALGRHTDGDFVLEEYNTSGVLLGEALSFTAGSGTLVTQGLTLSGSATIGGNLNMTSGAITNVLDPTAPQEVATKQYVDDIARSPDNLIINPHGLIRQETASAVTGDGAHFADQWALSFSAAGAAAHANCANEGGVSNFDPSYMYMRCLTAKPVLGATDYFAIFQRVEGVFTRRLKYGTALARQSWVRFRASASRAGTIAMTLRNGAGNRTFVAPVSITTTPTDYFVYVPGDTTGTWDAGANLGAVMFFTGAVNTNGQTATTNTWIAGAHIASTSQTNYLTNVNDQVNVTDVQWIDSDKLLPFIPVDYDRDLHKCMRYYQRIASDGLNLQNQSVSTALLNLWMAVPMRAAPVLAQAPSGYVLENSLSSVSNITLDRANDKFVQVGIFGSGGQPTGTSGRIVAGNGFALSARL